MDLSKRSNELSSAHWSRDLIEITFTPVKVRLFKAEARWDGKGVDLINEKTNKDSVSDDGFYYSHNNYDDDDDDYDYDDDQCERKGAEEEVSVISSSWLQLPSHQCVIILVILIIIWFNLIWFNSNDYNHFGFWL